MGKKKIKHETGSTDKSLTLRADTAALTPAQKAALTRAANKREAERLDRARAERLAQVVNLKIAGHSFEDIGVAIGASAKEVEQMLATDVARYVRSQPALRVYVRDWVSEKYTQLLDAVWDEASDKHHPKKLEHQDRAMKILDSMRKMHGADLPVQSEVKIETAPEAVEKLVSALAATQGLGYDVSIFDAEVIDEDDVHEAVEQSAEALADSAAHVGESTDDETDWDETDGDGDN